MLNTPGAVGAQCAQAISGCIMHPQIPLNTVALFLEGLWMTASQHHGMMCGYLLSVSHYTDQAQTG